MSDGDQRSDTTDWECKLLWFYAPFTHASRIKMRLFCFLFFLPFMSAGDEHRQRGEIVSCWASTQASAGFGERMRERE